MMVLRPAMVVRRLAEVLEMRLRCSRAECGSVAVCLVQAVVCQRA